MCLIAFAWRAHPRYRLVLVANRDEFHARPTSAMDEWPDLPGAYGGRDGLHGGGWLAIHGRRIAAVTNVRRPPELEGRSRGALVVDFLRERRDVPEALRRLSSEASHYRPFNLLASDGDALAYATNLPADAARERRFASRTLTAGVHALSNGALDAPWPKTERLKSRLEAWLAGASASTSDEEDVAPLFDALADTTIAPDHRLPETGVGLERERFLSPAFIVHETYGTRASTVVLIGDDRSEIIERRFGPAGTFVGERRASSPITTA